MVRTGPNRTNSVPKWKFWSCDQTGRARATKLSGDGLSINTKRFRPFSAQSDMHKKNVHFWSFWSLHEHWGELSSTLHCIGCISHVSYVSINQIIAQGLNTRSNRPSPNRPKTVPILFQKGSFGLVTL